jgi:hypothetical protein
MIDTHLKQINSDVSSKEREKKLPKIKSKKKSNTRKSQNRTPIDQGTFESVDVLPKSKKIKAAVEKFYPTP